MSELVKVLIIGNNVNYLAETLPLYGFEVCINSTKEQVIKTFSTKKFFDIVVIDFQELTDSFDLIKTIRKSTFYSTIPILTIGKTIEKAVYSLKLGADEYLTKPINIPLFLAKIEALIRRSKSTWTKEKFNNVTNNQNNKLNSLTEREKDVLLLVVQGANNKEIAEKLVLSEVTVKGHISKILKKLNVNSRIQAVLHVLKLNIEERKIY
jgi:DNA-binding NarL/FixJ family response regulator